MILALCGTSDGVRLLELLRGRGYPVIATVTTEYGAKCLGAYPDLEIVEKKLSQEELLDLIQEKQVSAIVDVTHPYAAVISVNGARAAEQAGIPYLRYQRRETEVFNEQDIRLADSFEAAARMAKEYPGKIFLTIGSNHLPLFVKEIGPERLIARVLPTAKVLGLCEGLGLTPGQIVAMKGPFDQELNEALFRHYRASVIVTKDSGEAGKTREKLLAAQSLGLPVILVKRPPTEGELVFEELTELVASLDDMLR